MCSMEMTFFILVFLAGGLWETEAMSVIGVLHGKVTVECSHNNAITNVKYFCKGACNYEDILITSRESNKDSTGKYSIKDEGNTFFVTIHRLKQDDAGTYWCGIERAGLDTYNKVVLTVTKEHREDWVQSNSETLAYIGAGLGVVMLALAIVLLIFLRHRNRDIGASSEKDQSTEYATRSSMKQDAQDNNTSTATAHEDEDTDDTNNGIFSSSTIQHQDTSRDQADNFYSTNSNATILSEAQKQPVSLLYCAVSFKKHTDCSTAIPTPATVTYSTIADISTDE